LDGRHRLPRQISQYLALVDYIQTVKDQPHLKRSLRAHLDRMMRYHKTFLEQRVAVRNVLISGK
jgi:hypothetical protein